MFDIYTNCGMRLCLFCARFIYGLTPNYYIYIIDLQVYHTVTLCVDLYGLFFLYNALLLVDTIPSPPPPTTTATTNHTRLHIQIYPGYIYVFPLLTNVLQLSDTTPTQTKDLPPPLPQSYHHAPLLQ